MAESIGGRLRHILTGKASEPEIPDPEANAQPAETSSPSSALDSAEPLPRIAPFIDMSVLPPDAAILNRPAPPQDEALPPDEHAEPPGSHDDVPLPPTPPIPTDVSGARTYQAELQHKMTALAEDFSLGKINRHQFEAVYTHYREQRQLIEALINSMSTADAWHEVVIAGQTGALLQQNAAQVLSYALYDNATHQPLAMSNPFKLDATLIAPMVTAYRAAAIEFGAKINSSEIDGGRWLCLVPGHYTTFVVLFSLEPARAQLTVLEDLHHDFELANAKRLNQGKGRECAEQFMQLWALERTV